MNWSQLYSVTQSPTQGINFYYSQILSSVRSGLQPNASSTPVYVTEYNDNWAFEKDCCRNDPTFGPLWNAVAITDFLNSVYTGASSVPSRIYYYAASEPPYFCIAGTWDSDMDCDRSQYDPYPQYYAYQLLATTDYLGLASGGYMAASVSSANPQAGLLVTAFFNSSQDTILIVNPTSTDLAGTSVTAENPGFNSAVATEYLLNQQNSTITPSALSLTSVSGGFAATVDVPSYSVVAVSL